MENEIKTWIIYRYDQEKNEWRVYAYTSDKTLKNMFKCTRKMCRYKIQKYIMEEFEYNSFVAKHVESNLMLYEGDGIDSGGNLFRFNIPVTVTEYNQIGNRITRIYMSDCHQHGFKPFPPLQDEYREALADLLYYAMGNFVRDRSTLTDEYTRSRYYKNTWNIVLDVIGGDLI